MVRTTLQLYSTLLGHHHNLLTIKTWPSPQAN